VKRAISLPLVIYLGVTLVVPLLNGGAARAEFWRHASEVVAVAATMIAFRVAGRYASKRIQSRRAFARDEAALYGKCDAIASTTAP
jgi:hypothetical protein